MYGPIEIPSDCVMLFNYVRLKPGVTVDDAELALGEVCELVKRTYPEFIAGQVFKAAGFISDEGSMNVIKESKDHLAVLTYWSSFEAHERSHADQAFKDKFAALLELSESAWELGYSLLWQGQREIGRPHATEYLDE